jgi:hypothetical protein
MMQERRDADFVISNYLNTLFFAYPVILLLTFANKGKLCLVIIFIRSILSLIMISRY